MLETTDSCHKVLVLPATESCRCLLPLPLPLPLLAGAAHCLLPLLKQLPPCYAWQDLHRLPTGAYIALQSKRCQAAGRMQQ